MFFDLSSINFPFTLSDFVHHRIFLLYPILEFLAGYKVFFFPCHTERFSFFFSNRNVAHS